MISHCFFRCSFCFSDVEFVSFLLMFIIIVTTGGCCRLVFLKCFCFCLLFVRRGNEVKKETSLYLIALGYFSLTIFFLYIFSFIAFTWFSIIVVMIGMCISAVMVLRVLGKTEHYKWIEK